MDKKSNHREDFYRFNNSKLPFSASLGVPKCNFTSYPTMPATPVVLSPALLGVFTKQLHPYALPATRLSVRIQGQPILPIPEMMGRKHMQEI